MGPRGTRAQRPLPPDNFAANRGPWTNTYTAGSAITFSWTYRVRSGGGRAAGEVLAGKAIGSGQPTREGIFRVEIYTADGLTLKRTIDVDDDTGLAVYANVDLVTDFGAEPASFLAVLAVVASTWMSDTRSITITKRT